MRDRNPNNRIFKVIKITKNLIINSNNSKTQVLHLIFRINQQHKKRKASQIQRQMLLIIVMIPKVTVTNKLATLIKICSLRTTNS